MKIGTKHSFSIEGLFGKDDNEAVILASDGAEVAVPRGPKTALAHVLWDEVVRRAGRRNVDG